MPDTTLLDIPYGQKMQPHYFTSSYAPTMIHSSP